MEFRAPNEEFFKFIDDHINDDPVKLRLKYHKVKDSSFDILFAITQIECRQRTKKKIPHILCNKQFLFPTKLLSEQCTDEIIADFHAGLFDGCKNVIDMTAGLFVDTIHISRNVKSVIGIEMDEFAAEIGKFNTSRLTNNINVVCADSTEYLQAHNLSADAIFIDPARRDSSKNRVYNLVDCSPNIIELKDDLRTRCKFVIVKASPMIDISDTIRRVPEISDIYVIGIKNECKEILFKINYTSENQDIVITTINFAGESPQIFKIAYNNTDLAISPAIPQIGHLLYEPNNCIMKSGGFNTLSGKFGVAPISSNTHLFTSDKCISEFPGRIFNIEDIVIYKKNKIKGFNKIYPQINIATRNFPIPNELLKKELKIKDGGEKYLFGVTCQDKTPMLLICKKINV